MQWNELTEPAIRIGLAFALGAAVGIERWVKKHPAGFRTMSLVCVGSAGFTLVGVEGLSQHAVAPDAVSRVLQGLMTGIGFLGAGSIVRDRGNVHGLTTASAVWVIAAVGAACGLGLYPLAILLASITLFALLILGFVERVVEQRTQGMISKPPRPSSKDQDD
ncbi:MAG TPA: MgtC/SapB family protein [Phycisphaerales bacterium]